MTVERLISEPTAAALSYNVNNKDNKHVMVYDLGGGTFDVTVLEVNGSTLDIKASNGILISVVLTLMSLCLSMYARSSLSNMALI